METVDFFIREFLKAHKEFKNEEFTENHREFIYRYCIRKNEKMGDTKPNFILKELNEKIQTVTLFYQGNKHVEVAVEELAEINKRYNSKKDKGFKDFNEFLEWWFNPQHYKDGEKFCVYCGVKESVVKAAFTHKNKDGKTIMSSKKTAFSKGTMQIERIEAPSQNDIDNGNHKYTKDNCVFACVLCNNAKSDMIDCERFKPIAKGIRTFWDSISKDIEK